MVELFSLIEVAQTPTTINQGTFANTPIFGNGQSNFFTSTPNPPGTGHWFIYFTDQQSEITNWIEEGDGSEFVRCVH